METVVILKTSRHGYISMMV